MGRTVNDLEEQGAASAVVVILMYVYCSSLILFLGVEFTQVHAETVGARIVTSANAEPVTEEARAEQGIPRRTATGASDRRRSGSSRHSEPRPKNISPPLVGPTMKTQASQS